jgi:hypothetical protein
MKKNKINTPYKARTTTIKILVSIMFSFFLIGFASAALDFDNKLTYENSDMKVKFENTFGLGKDLGTIELKSHSSVTEIKSFGWGKEEVVMYYDFEGWELYRDGLGEVEFIDMRTGEQIDKDYYFVEWKEIDVPNMIESCKNTILPNETFVSECSTIQEGTKKEYQWVIYDSSDIPNRNVRLGLKTYVGEGDYIDGIWTIVGKKVSKHITWTGDLTTGHLSYWKFDLNSSTVKDDLNRHNGTAFGVTRGVAGKFNTAFQYAETVDFVNITSPTGLIGTEASGSMWVNLTGEYNSVNTLFWLKHTASGDYMNLFFRNASFLELNVNDGVEERSIANFTDYFNQSTFIYWSYNATYLEIYINNVLIENQAITFDLFTGMDFIKIGNGDGARGTNGVIDEISLWNRTLSAEERAYIYNAGIGCPLGDDGCGDLVPTITLNSPINDTNSTVNNISFNCTASDDFELVNVSFILDGSVNETNSSGVNSVPYIFNKTLSLGDHYWTCRGVDNASNFVTAGENLITIERVHLNSQTFNTTSYETELNNFTANISYTSSLWTDIEVNLYYNSTKYPASVSAGSGDELNYSVTIARLFTAPITKPFFWNFRVTNATGTFDSNSSSTNQEEKPILFIVCNTTATTPYINFSFKDEGNLSSLNASIPTSTFVHTLGNFTINKTLTYINNTENDTLRLCFDPPNRTLSTIYSLQYTTGGYQQRVVEEGVTLTDSITEKILYLLSNADGIFVTFQVINQAEQPVENAIINASRVIDGTDTIVGTGLTDAAGSQTFWLNPDFSHTINAFAIGFPQFITTLFPTQSSYTINLGTGASISDEDYTIGITTDIFQKGSLLNESTVYTFNYTLASTFWTIDEFGFTLEDDDSNVFDTQTASTNGGTVTTTLNTTSNTSIIMKYYWLIDGNYTNSTKIWTIYNDIEDDSWSIKIFFADLQTYLTSGLFGLDSFGLGLIVFIVIFIFTGIIAIKFPAAINSQSVSVILFALVLFFDVGLGLIPNPTEAVVSFPTIFVGLIMIGVFVREALR